MARIPKVLLLLETSREYGRGLLRGIARYAYLHGPWEIIRLTPFYLRSGNDDTILAASHIPDIDGIIMREQKDIRGLPGRKIPVIFANYINPDIPFGGSISTQNDKIGQMVAKHFLQRGFRHFAYLGYDDLFWSQQRLEGFCQEIQHYQHLCEIFRQSLRKSLRLWETEQEAVVEWLKILPKPAGLMCCNDDRALQALEACRLACIRVPEDIAIVGADNVEFICRLSHPPLSSVALNLENAGFEAAALLHKMMRKKIKAPPTIRVEATHIVTRQSSDVLAIDDAVVVEAIRYIRQHIRQPIQVADILRQVAVSRRGLYDKFQRTLGCTIHAYIKRNRVEEIEKLLANTEFPISRIAAEMGFSGPEHISEYFRSVTGVNPLVYRRRTNP